MLSKMVPSSSIFAAVIFCDFKTKKTVRVGQVVALRQDVVVRCARGCREGGDDHLAHEHFARGVRQGIHGWSNTCVFLVVIPLGLPTRRDAHFQYHTIFSFVATQRNSMPCSRRRATKVRSLDIKAPYTLYRKNKPLWSRAQLRRTGSRCSLPP